MIVSIHQPNYLPYLGYFDKMAKCDVFILYDDAEFVKEMFYHRNRIKTPNGPLWLTVPVLYRFSEHPPISELRIDNTKPWNTKHWRTIVQNYSKSIYFSDLRNLIEPIYQKKWEYLSELNIELIRKIKEYLRLRTKLVKSSEFNITGNRSEKLLRLCKEFNASVYVAGETGKKYLNEEMFLECGISVKYQVYNHPMYKQLHGDFLKNMGIVDLISNEGPKSLTILSN